MLRNHIFVTIQLAAMTWIFDNFEGDGRLLGCLLLTYDRLRSSSQFCCQMIIGMQKENLMPRGLELKHLQRGSQRSSRRNERVPIHGTEWHYMARYMASTSKYCIHVGCQRNVWRVWVVNYPENNPLYLLQLITSINIARITVNLISTKYHSSTSTLP